jgi:hypothetical protein
MLRLSVRHLYIDLTLNPIEPSARSIALQRDFLGGANNNLVSPFLDSIIIMMKCSYIPQQPNPYRLPQYARLQPSLSYLQPRHISGIGCPGTDIRTHFGA